jgi:hypothetical protein
MWSPDTYTGKILFSLRSEAIESESPPTISFFSISSHTSVSKPDDATSHYCIYGLVLVSVVKQFSGRKNYQ